MTLYNYYMLDGVGSPFLSGTPYCPADIGIFLWLLSPEHTTCVKKKKEFISKIKDIKIAKAEAQINEYLEITFADMDTLQETKKEKAYSSFLAYQIDLYAKEYGWCIKEILNLPLRQIFQINTAIAERHAKAMNKKYTKMRTVDAIEAKAILDMAKKRKTYNN